MKRIGSVFGFPLYAQPTYLLLIVLYVFPNARSLEGLTAGLVAATLVTLSILIHELGHAFAFRAFGDPQATIVLWGLGGLTYGRSPSLPWQSIVVSLAGPLVGLAVGLPCLVLQYALGSDIDPRLDTILDLLVFFNIFWTFFNLLPLHPMDGGHAFRTLLVSRMGSAGLRLSLVVSMLTAIGVGLLAWFAPVVTSALGMDPRPRQFFVVLIAGMMLLRNIGELRGDRSDMPPNPSA